MRIHLIAIGGSAMHSLAIALYSNHHTVTGSDDEIYNPSKDRLKKYGLFPAKLGWDPARITSDIDAIVLGMHARPENPELIRAQELGIQIYSYPSFLYEHAKEKIRVVIAGSHGKTSTTAMIMHVLKESRVDFDFLVGAQIEGFDTTVRLSEAPLIIIEGDEYLSSPIDRKPKILHYLPHFAVITGIAWDHINVFPSFKNYLHQFELFVETIDSKEGKLFFYGSDSHLMKIIQKMKRQEMAIPYYGFESRIINGITYLLGEEGKLVPLQIFGDHNLQNLKAAYLICRELGISDRQFFSSISTFKGASKRLQMLTKKEEAVAFLDFAHAPSKVKATIEAMKTQYPGRRLIACLELHTFSSLNKKFLANYKGTMDAADEAYVFFSKHTLSMKRLPMISAEDVKKAFGHPNMSVITDNQQLVNVLQRYEWQNKNLLFMSSGTFGGLDLKSFSKEIFAEK